ncbi:MAG: 2-oxo-4-hydroxy-4-carboxy-5-ureidoimidazoline decarboxylase [Pirellulales bacterium]
MACTLAELNACDVDRFMNVCGPLYEHSPWVAERALAARPFASLAAVHAALQQAVASATAEEQLALISAHPDLVGRAAREGRLTAASMGEQSAAGLHQLSPAEAAAFGRYNAAYRDRFGFPFVICAREHTKEAILAAFPVRLGHTADEERQTALAEIGRIGRLRLLDAVTEL